MKREQQSTIDKNPEPSQIQQQQSSQNPQNQQQQNQPQENFPEKIQQELKPYINHKGQFVYEQFNSVKDQKYKLQKPIQYYSLQQTLEYERKKLKHHTLDIDNKSTFAQPLNRLEESSRNYKCGCGKKYLSYPALYTHIKTKHSGTAPDGTINISQTTSKRGRPRRLEYQREDDNLNEIEPNICEQIQLLMKNDVTSTQKEKSMELNQVCKEDLSGFLDTLEENFEGKSNALEGMPVYNDCNTLLAHFHKFMYYIVKIQDGKMSPEINPQTPCDKIFSIFLLNVAQFVNLKLYRIICIFFRLLRECVNQNLYQIIHQQANSVKSSVIKLEKDTRNEKNKEFTEIESAKFIPIIGEKLILKFLPEKCPSMDQTFASYLFLDFCKWLVKKRVTKIKTEFHETALQERDSMDHLN